MTEINSFNQLFAEAKERGLFLDGFYQDAAGAFRATWRVGARIPGEHGPQVERIHPFNAARDALLAMTDDEEDLFG